MCAYTGNQLLDNKNLQIIEFLFAGYMYGVFKVW